MAGICWHPTHKNGDELVMVYEIAIPTLGPTLVAIRSPRMGLVYPSLASESRAQLSDTNVHQLNTHSGLPSLPPFTPVFKPAQ